MKKVLAAVMSLAFLVSFYPAVSTADTACPEVDQAKTMLKQMSSGEVSRTLAGARSQHVQAPRSQQMQAPRSQDVQAPRGQDVQAPRGQDIQAPRSQDVQAPRGQDIQAPRSQNIQAPRSQDVQAPRTQVAQSPRSAEFNKAATLVKEAEAACKAGNMTMASDKAKAAMELLKSK